MYRVRNFYKTNVASLLEEMLNEQAREGFLVKEMFKMHTTSELRPEEYIMIVFEKKDAS